MSPLVYVMKVLLSGDMYVLELVSKELNHLAAILHVYAGGLIFMKEKEKILFFKKKMEILLHFLSFL